MVEPDSGAAAAAAPDPSAGMHEDMRRLLGQWTALREAAVGTLPSEAAVLAGMAEALRSDSALIVPGRRSGFVIERAGLGLIRRFGRYAAGDRVSSLAPGIREEMSRKLVAAVKSRAAVVGEGRMALGRVIVPYDEIVLPLADESGRIARLLLVARERWPQRSAPGRDPVEAWFAALEGRSG